MNSAAPFMEVSFQYRFEGTLHLEHADVLRFPTLRANFDIDVDFS